VEKTFLTAKMLILFLRIDIRV